MKDILAEIAERTRERVTEQKKSVSLEEMVRKAENACKNGYGSSIVEEAGSRMGEADAEAGRTYFFKDALSGAGIHLICEVKKASPSKGIIAEEFPYVEIAKDYERGGASAISVLTEPYYFLGSNEYLREIRKEVSIPILRKDFIVDEYQIYETKALGADACLLICAILDQDTLTEYLNLAHRLGLSALVETHDEAEIGMAVKAGAGIIGVNNRNLKDFSVDISHSQELRRLVPDGTIFVAESGIREKEQVVQLYREGVNAVLIGETLMRAPDRAAVVGDFAQVSKTESNLR